MELAALVEKEPQLAFLPRLYEALPQAEWYLVGGAVRDLMMGRGNTGPVYPWFGKDIRQGINLAVENYALLRRYIDGLLAN